MYNLAHLFPSAHYAIAIKALEELYNEVDQKIASWIESSSLTCISGCGLCCSKFEPDVISLEADYAALYLCYEKPLLLEKLDPLFTAKHCIFYDQDQAAHCRIYPARPLLCRLFAFAAVSSKDNNPAFCLCTEMKPELTKRLYKGKEIEEYFHSPLPLMHDYSIRMNNILAGAVINPLPLRNSIFQSINKIRLLSAYAAEKITGL